MRVVVMDDYQGVAAEMADWSSLGPDVEMVALREHIADEADLAAALAGAEVVVCMRERTKVTAALLARLPDVRLIVTTGPFNASIDIAAANARGIPVSGTSGSTAATPELTWALILAARRHLIADDATMRSGGWQTRIGTELEGQRLGLLGLGRIGSRVARVALAFGMDVVAWSQNLTPERCAEAGVGYLNQDELFATSDIVSIHLVLSRRTRGLVGRDQLRAMKPTALFVNTSRGPIVDEAALIDVLERGAIAGAAIDVYNEEPLPADHPFRRLTNTVLTPHIGYVTRQCYEVFFRHIVEDIQAWKHGAPLRVLSPPP
jgi:phosphoglycerate dehydrogenase-like enzyme